jgi:HK97 family phage prohead protease
MSADAILARRQRKFADLSLEKVTGSGRFVGYASLFDAVDMGRDAIAPGAFAASLSKRGAAGIRMLFQHDPNEPIGRWLSIREDERGLQVEGQLATGVARAREIHALMAEGALDGLSIGFRTVRARTDAKTGVRRIIEADLWEISVVTFPMLPGARVSAVKGVARPTKRELERWLVRDAGLTRSEARSVMAKGFDGLAGAGGRDAAGGKAQGLAGTIRRAARGFTINERAF